jgi:hypothetical protein
MLSSFLSHANYWAILVSAVSYFLLGSLWFSVLFGKIWAAQVEKLGVKIQDPEKKTIGMKMIRTFFLEIVAVFCIAYLVYVTGVANWMAGLKLGLLCGLGFASAGIAIAFTWESRAFTLLFIDCGYTVLGLAVSGVILAVWH